MRSILMAALLAAFLVPLPALAQSDANCVVDLRGNRVCGTQPGQCILDRYRSAWCAG